MKYWYVGMLPYWYIEKVFPYIDILECYCIDISMCWYIETLVQGDIRTPCFIDILMYSYNDTSKCCCIDTLICRYVGIVMHWCKVAWGCHASKTDWHAVIYSIHISISWYVAVVIHWYDNIDILVSWRCCGGIRILCFKDTLI